MVKELIKAGAEFQFQQKDEVSIRKGGSSGGGDSGQGQADKCGIDEKTALMLAAM